MPDTIPLICRSCGDPFDGTPKTQFCPDCKKVRHREKAKESARKQREAESVDIGPHDVVCIICGKTFSSTKAVKKCSDCRNCKKYHADWYQAHREEQKGKSTQHRRALLKSMTPEELKAFKAHEAERAREYYAANKAALNAKRAQRNRERIAAMTPEEKRAYYDALYAKRRECKRKKEEQSE